MLTLSCSLLNIVLRVKNGVVFLSMVWRQLFTLVSGWVTGFPAAAQHHERVLFHTWLAQKKIKVQNLSMVSARCFWFCAIVNLKII